MTVLHRALAVLNADRRCNFRRPKAGAILEYARVPYRLHVGQKGSPKGCILGIGSSGKFGRAHIEHQCVLHLVSPQ
jgi:hypothetical protein